MHLGIGEYTTTNQLFSLLKISNCVGTVQLHFNYVICCRSTSNSTSKPEVSVMNFKQIKIQALGLWNTTFQDARDLKKTLRVKDTGARVNFGK